MATDTQERQRGELLENVVKIKRCAAVVKGGRRFSFAAMVVVGDGNGRVGWGYGKANEVPPSVEKARKEGMRSMVDVPLEGHTIPHTVKGRFGAACSTRWSAACKSECRSLNSNSFMSSFTTGGKATPTGSGRFLDQRREVVQFEIAQTVGCLFAGLR